MGKSGSQIEWYDQQIKQICKRQVDFYWSLASFALYIHQTT